MYLMFGVLPYTFTMVFISLGQLVTAKRYWYASQEGVPLQLVELSMPLENNYGMYTRGVGRRRILPNPSVCSLVVNSYSVGMAACISHCYC